jgi:hypothetical protein
MMEGFKAEGLAFSGRRSPAARAHDALASVQKRLDGEWLMQELVNNPRCKV